MPYTAKEKAFIQYVKSRCKEHGVQCRLSNTRSVHLQGSTRCSGYFDETIPMLASSLNHPEWIGILAHEYSHLTQWVEQIPLWKEGETSLRYVWEWLEGVDCDDIEYHLDVARDLELDNEKRAVNIIQRFDLNIDVEEYIRKANAYVLFYNYMKESRKWCKIKNSPSRNEKLVAAMSSKFNMNYSKLSKKVAKIFREENI